MGIGLVPFPPVKARFGDFVLSRYSQVSRERVASTPNPGPNSLSLFQIRQHATELARQNQDIILGVGPRLMPVELTAWLELSRTMDDFRRHCSDVVFCSNLLIEMEGEMQWAKGFVIEGNSGSTLTSNPYHLTREELTLLGGNQFLTAPERTIFINLSAPQPAKAGEIRLLVDLDLFRILVFHLGYLKACHDYTEQGCAPGSVNHLIKLRDAAQYEFGIYTSMQQAADSSNPPDLLKQPVNKSVLHAWGETVQAQLAEAELAIWPRRELPQ